MEKFELTWQDFNQLTDEIVQFYKEKGITKIIGVARGGLPLAVTLSHKLNVPMETLAYQTRDGCSKDMHMIHRLSLSKHIETTLFVDDICDSGKTIEEIRLHIPQSKWCTLISKKENLTQFAPVILKDERWITFPWE